MADSEHERGQGEDGNIRSGARKVGSILAYPFTRPYRDIRASADALGQQWQRYRQNSAEHQRQVRSSREAFVERTQGLSPREKFEQEALRGAWTPQDLRQQERAARIGRRMCLVGTAVGVVGFGLMMVSAGWVMVLAAGVLIMVLVASMGALAVRYAWWEFQLQGRVLIPMGEFFARPDLFRRLFK